MNRAGFPLAWYGRSLRWLAGLALVAGCSSSPSDNGEQLAHGQEPLSSIGNIQGIISGTTETSATTYPSANSMGIGTIFTVNTCEWVVSASLGQSGTWVSNHCTNPGYVWPTITMSSGSSFSAWAGDNWVAQTGWNDVVVIASLAQAADGTFDVGLVSSKDSASSFTKAVTISDSSHGGGGGASGHADGPIAQADPVNHVVWVWWWANLGGGTGNAYVRPVSVASDGTMTPGTTITLGSGGAGLAVGRADQSLFAVAPPGWQGASGTTLFLVYRDIYESNSFNCPNQSTVTVNWTLAWSTNSGSSFSTISLGQDKPFPLCLSNLSNSSTRFRGAATYDPISTEFLFSLSRPIHDTGGNYVGMRAELYQWPSVSAGKSNVDFWMPLCHPYRNIGTGQLIELINGQPPVGETFCNQFGSTVAASTITGTHATSSAAWTWFSTVDSTSPANPAVPLNPPSLQWQNFQVDVWGASVTPGSPYDANPQTVSRITALGGNVPWAPLDSNGNTWWGDYQGMAGGASNGTFITTWADDRNDPTETVYAATFKP